MIWDNQTGLAQNCVYAGEKKRSSQHFPDTLRKRQLHSQRFFSISSGLHESRKRKKKNNCLKGTLKGPLLRNENWKHWPVNLGGNS